MSEFQAYVDHFSESAVSTGVALHQAIKSLKEPEQVVVTQDAHFDLLRFAESGSDDPTAFRELPDSPVLRRLVFVPPKRRREGHGSIEDSIEFGSFGLDWKGTPLVAIVAKWVDARGCAVRQWHIVGTAEAAKALVEACCAWCGRTSKAILIFERGGWRADSALWAAVQTATWDDVILDDQLKAAIKRDYVSFFRNEELYKGLQVPWKRGLILMGPPGNGKTISLKAIMRDVGVPSLYVKTFACPQGDEFAIRNVFLRARSEAPCVLILEDLDSLIKDTNRSFFLNEVDGLEDNDGILMIGTTNHVERLDPALSNRPSRFDRKHEFRPPASAERTQYAKYWQAKLSSASRVQFSDGLVNEIVERTEGFSFAYLKEIFISALLAVAMSDEDGEHAPPETGFSSEVMKQIEFLNTQLQSGSDGSMAASWQQCVKSGPSGGIARAMSHAMPAMRMMSGPGGTFFSA